jgi:opacity protein-like surface antigen
MLPNMMFTKKTALLTILFFAFSGTLLAQDTTGTDLIAGFEKEMNLDQKNQTNYTTATFKTTRLINGNTVEHVGKGVLDVKISHRFGKLNGGGYELFGLDNAVMRFGFDYGITDNLMIGIGRSSFQKTYDAFLKVKILKQSTGKKNMPITLCYVPTIALKSVKFEDPTRKNLFSSRLYYTHQLIIARKFSENTSVQLMPSYIHHNLVKFASESNDQFAMGIGGRQKISKRVSINAEYYYQLPGNKLTDRTNSLSLGFDIETGGHVFQLHFTNSRGLNESNFITETTGHWDKGDIYFGFNISRVFTIRKRKL